MTKITVVNSAWWRRRVCGYETLCCIWRKSRSDVYSTANIRRFCEKCSWSWWRSTDTTFNTQAQLRWTDLLLTLCQWISRSFILLLNTVFQLNFLYSCSSLQQPLTGKSGVRMRHNAFIWTWAESWSFILTVAEHLSLVLCTTSQVHIPQDLIKIGRYGSFLL